MKKLINWKKIWKDFDKWYDGIEAEENSDWSKNEWDAQQKEIQRLVDEQIIALVESFALIIDSKNK